VKRYPLAALLEATGLTEYQLTSRLRAKGISFDGTTLKRAREKGLVETAADRYACAVGFVPWLVWPQMRDDIIADCSVPCEECGDPFVPKMKGHRFCAQRCASRNWKRRRYQADPEFRARENARTNEYHAAARRAARLYAAAYRKANADRLREKRRQLDNGPDREDRLAARRALYAAQKAVA
jgi:hypothetical protein